MPQSFGRTVCLSRLGGPYASVVYWKVLAVNISGCLAPVYQTVRRIIQEACYGNVLLYCQLYYRSVTYESRAYSDHLAPTDVPGPAPAKRILDSEYRT